MKLLKLLFVLPLFSCVTLFSQTQIFDWAKACSGNNNEQGNSIAIDANGNQYITGFFEGTVDFDPGNGVQNKTSNGYEDCFILKLSPTGNFVWVQTFGSASNSDKGLTIKVDGSYVYIGGEFTGTVDVDGSGAAYNLISMNTFGYNGFVLKLDLNGNFIWAFSIASSNGTHVHDLSINSSGKLNILGTFSGSVDFDPGTGTANENSNLTSSFILAIDANKLFQWVKKIAGEPKKILNDQNNFICLLGRFSGTVDFDPSSSGTFNLSQSGTYQNTFILKLDHNGNFFWVKHIPTPLINSYTDAYALSIDSNNDNYISGSFAGTVDFDPGSGVYNISNQVSAAYISFILKLDANGNFIWAKSFGKSSTNPFGVSTRVHASYTDTNDNLYFTGSFSNNDVDFNPDTTLTYNLNSNGNALDVFILKLDVNGNYIWAKSFGGNADDLSSDIFVDANFNVFTTGSFIGIVDFNTESGTTYLSSLNSSEDIFIHKLKNNSTTIVNDIDQNSAIIVYPNPASSEIKINTKTETPKNILVYDMLGKLVLNEKPTAALHTLHIQELTKGIYFLQLEFEQKTETIKIIKQ